MDQKARLLPRPYLISALDAPEETISRWLVSRKRINIASANDAGLMNRFIYKRPESIPQIQILRLDASNEDQGYTQKIQRGTHGYLQN